MATVDRDILTIVEPTIPLDDLFMEDMDSEEAQNEKSTENRNETTNQDSLEGGAYPVVQINSIKISPDNLVSMEIRLDSEIPQARFVINDVDDKFNDVDYPLDGDVVSVYIRPRPIDQYRPIRMDFDIMSISSVAKQAPDPATFTFNCILKVPLMYADVVQGFSEGTSFDHLIECAEGLGLGFASNEDSTDDSMNRICANQNRNEFIKHTTLSAYKDDNSFFTSYIDPHYYLCFVNINKQFSEVDEMEQAPAVPQLQDQLQVPGDPGAEEGLENASLRLSNGEDVAGSNMMIGKYVLKNQSGNVWRNNGYARNVKYLNLNENLNGGDNGGLEEFLITPLNTDGAEDNRIPLRGRASESFWQDMNKVKYVGKQPSEDFGNVHSNFMYAIGQNFANMDEIGKLFMEVDLETVNWALYRYQRIPVIIYNTGEVNNKNLENRDSQLGENEQPPGGDEDEANYTEPNQQVKNEFLTGYYVISDIIYKYEGDTKKITQSLKLLRREWPIPGKLSDN